VSDNPTTTEVAEGTVAAAETAQTSRQPSTKGSTPDATETAATDDPGDVFPRSVVEKLRKESAGLRDRAKNAEDRLSAMQRQVAAQQITAAGMRPEAVWAVAQLGDLLADDGTVDPDQVARAMATARQTLGIEQRRAPFPGQGELNSGARSGPPESPAGWTAAFGPREK